MPWGSLQFGRIALRETYALANQVNATTGEQSVGLEGMESSPPFTDSQIIARSEDMVAMLDRAMPVIFSLKETQTGFYTVKDVGAVITEWPEAKWFTWTLSLVRIGAENAVDMESRLGTVIRVNDFSNVGERWHAPAVGAYAYFTGIGTPPSGTMSRVMADSEGTLTIFRGLPAGANPTWGITAPNYLLGRSRVLVGGVERSGVGIRVAADDWSLTNGLVRVTPLASSAMLKVEYWDGAAWSGYDFDITATSDLTPPFDAMTVIRNDFECVVIRLVYDKGPGRLLVDLTLRRGARFVEGFIQTDASATLGVKTDTAVAGTNSTTGWVHQTANDGNGNRLVVGSPRTFTANTSNTGLSKAASTELSFFIGGEIDGTSAVQGDQADDLYAQYIGTMSEQVLAVKR